MKNISICNIIVHIYYKGFYMMIVDEIIEKIKKITDKNYDVTLKDKNFECGIESIGNARIPFSIKYFLVAILFVLFDVEVIFLYPWAVNFRDLGVEGLVKMIIFMALLMIGFLYIIKKRALEWE